MTAIEQAARAASERPTIDLARHIAAWDQGVADTQRVPHWAVNLAMEIREYLLSDENVEKAASAIHEVVEAGTPWDETTAIQRTDRRSEARHALSAVLGKEQ